ncbi:MAG: Two component signal transduction histidine kinase [Frankiales bacterium]|nr:Two component signal transduction histidine kinase [Frankiales bacterium]
MGVRRHAGWALVGLTLALDVVGSAVYSRADGIGNLALVTIIWTFTLASGIAGALIIRRHPAHRVGWLLAAQGPLVGLVLWADSYLDLAVKRGHLDWPFLGSFAAWSDNSWPLLFLSMASIGYLFPTGRPVSPFWKRWQLICFAAFPLIVIGGWFSSQPFAKPYQEIAHPVPSIPGFSAGIWLVSMPLLLGYLIGATLAARSRLKRATGTDRLQLLWFAWVALLVPFGLLACFVDGAINGTETAITLVAISVAGTLIPVAIGIAILRYQLFDIELVVSKTLLYAGLVTIVSATYAGVVFGLGSLISNRGVAGFIAVLLVAVLVEPLRSRLHRRAQHWVYGDRSDPYLALSRLGDRLQETLAPLQVLSTVCDTLLEALRLTYVGMSLSGPDGLRVITDSGERTGRERRAVPLAYQGNQMGELILEGGQLSPADERLLADLARQAGVAVHAVRLSLDLQHSRARLVAAQEEERRRLRRDLHDGLGPELASIVMRLDGARHMSDGPVHEVLTELLGQTRGAVGEIRRLVEGLRPPALDEVGLVGALRQQALRLSDGPVTISVSGPDASMPLAAAVEVAAYRIAMEAMTNAVRHARAARCHVEIVLNGHLEVLVRDDGVGVPSQRREGVGLASMRERAAELGGTCDVSLRPEGGTEVLATLPT